MKTCRVWRRRTRCKRKLDAAGMDALAENLRGLTEEEAERPFHRRWYTATRFAPETITDVQEAKKELLRRSEMLDFIAVSENLASVGGLDNLKHWLRQRQRNLGRLRARVRTGAAARRDHSWRAGLRQEYVCAGHRWRVETSAGEVRYRCDLRQVHRRD